MLIPYEKVYIRRLKLRVLDTYTQLQPSRSSWAKLTNSNH